MVQFLKDETPIAWNNRALLNFGSAFQLEYIEDALRLISNELQAMASGKLSIQGAKVLGQMMHEAISEGYRLMTKPMPSEKDGFNYIKDIEAIKVLTALFIDSMPVQKPQTAEGKPPADLKKK